ncbi:hypothetical protein OOU_Y34scaffold00568g5 [Pyricularia oryzae Y34]|uniref:Hydrophobin n=2 Tax=Pyricularia oryzae TaxID=318829 RepID=A0AA97NWY3_PYRO3|nr:hypothetical protein OOU_Y34scaffold00568g5 [Pyricularia oryzae Y34]
MLYKLAAVVLASSFVSTASAAFNFYCPGVNATGFYPSCCRGITGQVGVDCFSAHLIGGLPNFECNIGPPNNQRGCCQSIAEPVHRHHGLPPSITMVRFAGCTAVLNGEKGWLAQKYVRQTLPTPRLDQDIRAIEKYSGR